MRKEEPETEDGLGKDIEDGVGNDLRVDIDVQGAVGNTPDTAMCKHTMSSGCVDLTQGRQSIEWQ